MWNSLWWVFCMSHFLCELVEVVSCDIQLGSDIQLGTHAEGLAGLHLFNCPHDWSHLVGLYCCKYLPKSLPQQGIRCIIAKQLCTWFLERMKWSYVVLALTHRYVPMFPRMSWLSLFPAQTWQSHNFASLMILSWCCHKLIYVCAHWYAGLYEDNLRVRESTTHISSTHPEQQDYRSYWQQVEDSKIVVLRIIVVLIIAWSIDPYNAYPIAWKTTPVL